MALKKFFLKNYYLLTSVLIFLSFPSYDFIFLKFFPFFAWVSMVPLLVYVKGKPLKEVFLVSFITGLAGHLLAYGWIGNFGAVVPGGYFLILLFLIPSLTVFFTAKIILSEFLSAKFESMRIFIYPAVWILVDYIQSVGFIAFPWTYIGYSQYSFTPFIQMSAITGILGVNFIIILFNVSLAGFVFSRINTPPSGSSSYRNANFYRFAGSLLVVILVTLWGGVRLFSDSGEKSGKQLKVTTVQSCISPWENWGGNKYLYLGELVKYTDLAMVENPDFIIWSESATLEPLSFRQTTGQETPFDKMLFDNIRKWGRPLFTGEIGITIKESGKFMEIYPQNNAVLIDKEGKVVQSYAKIFLVPFGEWFPYEKIFPFIKKIITSFGASSFVPGEKPLLFEVHDLKFGPLICYEGIFHRLCRNYKIMGADFLINITNDGWTDTFNGHFQHFSASVFRAVENGLWVVRAGNTGVSAIVDPFGRVTDEYPILKKGFFTGTIYPEKNRHTFYSRSGDVVLYASALYVLFLFVLMFVKRVKKEN